MNWWEREDALVWRAGMKEEEAENVEKARGIGALVVVVVEGGMVEQCVQS